MCLGVLSGRSAGIVVGQESKQRPNLTETLVNFAKHAVPDFEFTSIQVNKNYLSALHVDKNNLGPSYIVGVGDYTDGELWVQTEGEMDCHDKWIKFDGNHPHCTMPYSGTRYTLIYFIQQSYELLGRAVSIQDDSGKWRKGEEAEQEFLDGWGFPVPPPGLVKKEYEDAKLRLMKGEEAYKWWSQDTKAGKKYVYENHKHKHKKGFHFKNKDFEMDRSEALEVEEEDGSWRHCTLYYMSESEIVVLWFGKDEYEGLQGDYRIVDGKLLDGDKDEVPYRRADVFLAGSCVIGAVDTGPLKSLTEHEAIELQEELEKERLAKERERLVAECVAAGLLIPDPVPPPSASVGSSAVADPLGVQEAGTSRVLFDAQIDAQAQASADTAAAPAAAEKESAKKSGNKKRSPPTAPPATREARKQSTKRTKAA